MNKKLYINETETTVEIFFNKSPVIRFV